LNPDAFNKKLIPQIKKSVADIIDNFNSSWEEHKKEIYIALSSEEAFPQLDNNISSNESNRTQFHEENRIEDENNNTTQTENEINNTIENNNIVQTQDEQNNTIKNDNARQTENEVNNLNLKELNTTIYKEKWFNKAKEIWNKENPNNPYTYEYYTYKFPKNGDIEAGTPPDNPILPKDWMQTAGLGFSKFLKYPFDETTRYQYTDAQVKEWKSKGFRNGRLHVPLYAMVDLDKDPTGATLKDTDLKKIKDICQSLSIIIYLLPSLLLWR